jgi:RimJ/RimL family protein N-acetyltransferase
MMLPFPETGLPVDELLVRLPRLDDLGTVAPAFQDPEVGGEAGLPPLDEEGLRTFHDEEMPALAESGALLPLLICDGASGEILGGASIGHYDHMRQRVEVGYWLLRDARGRGIATRVARALAEHALANGIERVEAVVRTDNAPSQRVLERAGFTREGVLRALLRHEGGRHDAAIYSLLPGE